jgi:hypothetical protein
LGSVVAVTLCGCSETATTSTDHVSRLIYFGFESHQETQDDIMRLAKTWGSPPPCSNWRVTINRQEADYQILFGDYDFTVIGKRGEVLYTGGLGVLYLPNGNPDGSGVNLCKMTK